MAVESDRIDKEHKIMVNAIRKILDEPSNTLSDSKALKEIMRLASYAAKNVKELSGGI